MAVGSADVWEPKTLLQLSANTKRIEEAFTATINQSLFTLTTFTYSVKTGALEVHKNGLLLIQDVDWAEGTTSNFTLVVPATAGDKIVATGYVGVTANVDVRDTDIYVTNYQAIRDYAGTEITLYAQGKATAGDRGQAFFHKLTGGTPGDHVDDNELVIVPTGGDGSIGWVRASNPAMATVKADSIAALTLLDLTGFDRAESASYLAGWESSVKGPVGGAPYHRDGTTGAPSTLYTNRNGFFDANGDGFIISLQELSPFHAGALGDNATDDAVALQAVFNVAKAVRIDAQFFTNSTIRTGMLAQSIRSEDFDAFLIRGGAAVDPVFEVNHWYTEMNRLYVTGGVTSLQIGTVAIKCNFASLNHCHTKGASVTGLKVVHGNIGSITSGMYENSPNNVHFTADTADTNGWHFRGPRAFGGVTNFHLEGDVNNRFTDDNHGFVTSEDYTGHGFKISAIRNTFFVYAESLHEASGAFGILDETITTGEGQNYIIAQGTTSVDPAGTFHGLLQSVSPIYHQAVERVSISQNTIDLTAGGKTHQRLGLFNRSNIINSGATPRILQLQKLDSHLLHNDMFLFLPGSNVGNITIDLDDPAGFTFPDGTTSRVFTPAMNNVMLKLSLVDTLVYNIEEIKSVRSSVQIATLNVTASISAFMSSYRDKTSLTITNTSGSTKNLTLTEMSALPDGFEFTLYSTGPDTINVLLSGDTFVDTTTSHLMGVNQAVTIRKVSGTVFARSIVT